MSLSENYNQDSKLTSASSSRYYINVRLLGKKRKNKYPEFIKKSEDHRKVKKSHFCFLNRGKII